jgi:hypothetical protein
MGNPHRSAQMSVDSLSQSERMILMALHLSPDRSLYEGDILHATGMSCYTLVTCLTRLHKLAMLTRATTGRGVRHTLVADGGAQ